MNSDRNEQIIYIILNYKTILISQLCNRFNISEKTVLRSILSINAFLKKFHLRIEVQGEKLVLEGDTKKIWEHLNSNSDIFNKNERLIYIFDLLLRSDNKVLKNDLVKDLEVPITQVKKDLIDLDLILNKFQSSLNSDLKDGIKLVLDKSVNVKSIFLELIFQNFFAKEIISFVKIKTVKNFFSEYIYNILKKNFKIDLFNDIYISLVMHVSKNDFRLNEIDILLLAMFVTVWLNDENNCHIRKTLIESKFEKWDHTLKHLSYQNDELNLMKQINNKDSISENENIEKCLLQIKNFVRTLFSIEKDFDDELTFNLFKHIQRSLTETNIQDELQIAHFLNEIRNYIDEYEVLWKKIDFSINQYFKEFNKSKKITYGIFIYIIVWMDAILYEQSIKILTVCIGGMGQSKMLESHLKTIYRRSKVDALPFALVNNEIIDNYDLVISSIEITNDHNKNTLHLPVVFSINNKEIIHKKINEIFYKQKLEKSYTEMQKILTKDNIFINLEKESKHDAIKRAGKMLLELGYIKPGYIDSMLKREEIVTTYIGNKIAIPHGEEGSQEMIIHSGIVILHYKEPIEFDGPVNFIVGIASKNNLHLEILANIAEKFSDLDKVEELLSNPSKDILFDEFKIED